MPRTSLVAVLAAVLCAGGATLLGASPAPAAATPTTMTWDLVTDMGNDPSGNPIGDSYGDAGVWSFLSGSGADSSAYQELDGLYTETCGDFTSRYLHNAHGYGTEFPFVGYYPTDSAGACGPTPYPTQAIVHPAADAASIIAWTSPVTGAVDVSGSVSDRDPGGGDGVTYRIVTGGSQLTSGTMDNAATATFSASAVPVGAGQTIYLLVGANATPDYDTTSVDLTVTTAAASSPVTLTSASPRYLSQARTTTVTLHGSGFDTHTAVSLSGDTTGLVPGTPTVVDPSTLKVRVSVAPNAAPGAAHGWTVSDASSTATSPAATLTVLTTPQLTSVAPQITGPGTSGDFYLTGVSFAPGMTARFSGKDVTVNSVSVQDDTHATVNLTIGSGARLGWRGLTLRLPHSGTSYAKKAIRLIYS